MAEILTPRCPVCDQDPVMVFGDGTQAICGNDDCNVLAWNPTHSLDQNLLNTNFVELTQRSLEEEDEGAGG